jgi:hypothetical protein
MRPISRLALLATLSGCIISNGPNGQCTPNGDFAVTSNGADCCSQTID